MDGEVYARVRRVFAAVIVLAAGDREAYLAEACEGDEEVRDEVESLLKFHRDSDRSDP